MTLPRLLQLFAVVFLALSLVGNADAARKPKQEDKEPLFPNATRQDPEIKPASRLNKQVMKMYDLSQEDDPIKTIEAAEKVLESKLAGAYEKSLALQTIGFAYVDQDDYPKAIEYLEKSLEANGLSNDNHYQIMLQLGQLNFAEENYERAIEVFNRFMSETKTEKPEHLALLGNAYYRVEKYEDAIKVLERAVQAVDEPNTTWLQLLMASYYELDRADDAAKIAEQLLAKNPNDAALLRNLSSIYLQQDQEQQALDILARGRQSGVLNEERDYTQLYQLYHYLENEAESIAVIEEGLAKGILKPSEQVYRALGEANYFAENMPAAADAYGKAAELAKDGEMSLNLARVLMELERYADAKAAANTALQKGVKRRGDAYIIIGGAELEQDNQAAAIAAYKEAAKYPETKSSAESWLKASGVR